MREDFQKDAEEIASHFKLDGDVTIIPTKRRSAYHFVARVGNYVLRCDEHKELIENNFEMLQFFKPLEIAPKPHLLETFNGRAFSLEEYLEAEPNIDFNRHFHLKVLLKIYQLLYTFDKHLFPASIKKNKNKFSVSLLKKHYSQDLIKLLDAETLLSDTSYFLHSDLNMNNLILREKALHFIDFERCSFGPKGLDFGDFLFFEGATLELFEVVSQSLDIPVETVLKFAIISGLLKALRFPKQTEFYKPIIDRTNMYLQLLNPKVKTL